MQIVTADKIRRSGAQDISGCAETFAWRRCHAKEQRRRGCRHSQLRPVLGRRKSDWFRRESPHRPSARGNCRRARVCAIRSGRTRAEGIFFGVEMRVGDNVPSCLGPIRSPMPMSSCSSYPRGEGRREQGCKRQQARTIACIKAVAESNIVFSSVFRFMITEYRTLALEPTGARAAVIS